MDETTFKLIQTFIYTSFRSSLYILCNINTTDHWLYLLLTLHIMGKNLYVKTQCITKTYYKAYTNISKYWKEYINTKAQCQYPTEQGRAQ